MSLIYLASAIQCAASALRITILLLLGFASPRSVHLSMNEEQLSTMESNTLLNEDPFRNENTQRLFEAIDELRSCGANHDVGLPEVSGENSAGQLRMLMSCYHSWSSSGINLLGNRHSCKA